MTRDQSTRNAAVTPVVTPSWQALLASLAVVTLGPVVAMVVYSHPLLGVGGLVGLLARPLLGLGLRITSNPDHAAGDYSHTAQMIQTETSLDSGGE